MKQIIIILISLNSAYCQFKTITFIGYKGRNPVFRDWNDALYIHINKNFVNFNVTVNGCSPFLCNNNKLIFASTGNKYIINEGNQKVAIFLKDVWDLSPTNSYDSLYYVEGDVDNEVNVKYNEIKIYDVKSKKSFGTGVKGLSPFVVEDFVFFMTYSIRDPQESTYDAVNLKRYKINRPNNIENLIDTASRSSIYVIPGNKYIITTVQRRDASIFYVVYNIKDQKYAFLNRKALGETSMKLFWDFNTNKICFYHPSKMTFEFWALPESFPNYRRDKNIVFFNSDGKPQK